MEGVLAYVTAFAGNFAPRNWAFCQGQILPISQNTALFSLLGTVYGGNGQTTFALPDLRGRAVVGAGQAPGLSSYDLGQVGGNETAFMNVNQLPAHTHSVALTITPKAAATADAATPVADVYAPLTSGNPFYGASPTVEMLGYTGAITMQPAGGNTPFSIVHPLLALNYVICMQGVFPARN